MARWYWATGESSGPGFPLAKAAESFVWLFGGALGQLASARASGCAWAAPDCLVVAILGWHWLWGLRGALAAAAILGFFADGLCGLPAGMGISSLAAAALIIDWMRGAAVGGLGGVWLGAAIGGALAASLWRAALWGWLYGGWPNTLDLVAGALLTMAAAMAIAFARRRIVRAGKRRLLVVGSANSSD